MPANREDAPDPASLPGSPHLAARHPTTLVFGNTRRMVERAAHHLSGILGADAVAAHHGSLARRRRLDAEQRLKSGAVSAMVATASLELGIDIGHVDVVCQVGAPRALSTLLQRVGRAGHGPAGGPRGVLFPLTRDDLVQCAAAVRAVRAGELDALQLPDAPLDILAQQMVAAAASEPDGIAEDDLFALVRRAWIYRNLPRAVFDELAAMLSDGVAPACGRRGAHLNRDGVNGRLMARRGARLAAITGGGAIPDTADYAVIEVGGEDGLGVGGASA